MESLTQVTNSYYVLSSRSLIRKVTINTQLCDVCPPGGSMSNIYAVNLARYRYCPNIKEDGLYAAERLVILTSQEVCFNVLIVSFNKSQENISRCAVTGCKPQVHWFYLKT